MTPEIYERIKVLNDIVKDCYEQKCRDNKKI